MRQFTSILIWVFFSLLSISLRSQNAYYDSRTIAGKLDSHQHFGPATFSILHQYFPNKKDNEIAIELTKNPFLNVYFDPSSVAGLGKFLSTNVLSSVGNLDVTNIADGLARFLIKRGQEELSVAFFQRMDDFLKQNVEAQTLFPATTTFLENIAAYRYSEFLQSLREAFYKDLSNLIINLNILIDLPKYQELLKALPEIRVAIRSVKIISELSQGDSSIHPANLISHFADLKEWGEINTNLGSSWRALDEISKSVRRVDYKIDSTDELKFDTVKLLKGSYTLKITQMPDNILTIDTNRIVSTNMYRVDSIITEKYDTIYSRDIAWIKFSDFNQNILQNEVTLRIYLGLLYQKMQGITFRYDTIKVISVQQFMSAYQDDIFKVADLVENFLVLANDVEQSIKDIGQKGIKSLTNDDYYTYIEKVINICDYGFKVANTIKEGIANDRYIVMARNANNLYKNIYTKNYNGAVMNAYNILQEVLVKTQTAIADRTIVLDSIVKNDTGPKKDSAEHSIKYAEKLNKSTLMNKDSVIKRSEVVGNILKYGNLMASIVKADNPQEAEAAIEAAVLPAGSSSIKKNTAWNISLNAYVGAYFATNYKNETSGNSSNIGVTGLVGVAFSKGLGHYCNGSPIGAISLYGSVIDIGAIVGYELNNDSTALNQKITLGQIFSPGGYLVYGIGLPFKSMSYIPISVGYGYQYGPNLYYKKGDGTLAVSDQTRWKSKWFVAIDIPLVNFWTKNYKNKN